MEDFLKRRDLDCARPTRRCLSIYTEIRSLTPGPGDDMIPLSVSPPYALSANRGLLASAAMRNPRTTHWLSSRRLQWPQSSSRVSEILLLCSYSLAQF